MIYSGVIYELTSLNNFSLSGSSSGQLLEQLNEMDHGFIVRTLLESDHDIPESIRVHEPSSMPPSLESSVHQLPAMAGGSGQDNHQYNHAGGWTVELTEGSEDRNGVLGEDEHLNVLSM